MRSPSEIKESGRQLLDAQLRQIDSLITNLKTIRDNPTFSREGMRILNVIQSDLLILMQTYGENLMSLMQQGYELD